MRRMIPKRWILSIMGLFGGMNLASLRLNLSSAIVEMVTASPRGLVEKVHQNASEYHPEFSWDANQQGLALGSYFYGYAVSQVFAAWSGRKCGRARVIGIYSLTASILTMLIPVLLREHFGIFIAARLLIGALSGSYSPLMHGMWGVWSPVEERGKHVSLMSMGYNSAAALVLVVSGYLAEKYGWEYPFYCTGAVGFIWSVIWIFVIYESPKEHPGITEDEIKLIDASVGKEIDTNRERKVKWMDIFKSTRVWCVIIVSFLEHMPTYIIILLPTYVQSTFELGVKESSFLSCIPLIARALADFTLGWLVDWIISKGYRTSKVRKGVYFTGNILAAIALISLTQATGSVVATISCYSFQASTSAVTAAGFKASVIDMAPGFSGVVFAVSNTAGSLMGFITPQYAGILRVANIKDQVMGWDVLFLTGSVLYAVSAVCFMLFGPVDVEKWAKRRSDQGESGQSESTRLVTKN